MARSRRAAQLIANSAPDAATAAGVAALGLAAGPAGAIAGAAAAPLVSRVVTQLVRSLQVARHARVAGVIEQAAQIAGLEPSVLVRRLQASPEHEELLVRTMRAAADAAAEEKLVMLATSLGSAATATPADAAREALFVRAIADLELLHIQVLQRFTWSANALGLGDGVSPDFDRPVDGLNARQLELAIPELSDAAMPVLSELARHGLLASVTTLAASSLSPAPLAWQLTEFGRSFLARMDLVGQLLAPASNGNGV